MASATILIAAEKEETVTTFLEKYTDNGIIQDDYDPLLLRFNRHPRRIKFITDRSAPRDGVVILDTQAETMEYRNHIIMPFKDDDIHMSIKNFISNIFFVL